MANRYWIGNGGNWSDIAHWSTTTGGVGGASVPTSADNAYFDANSFISTGQTVTVDVTANCLDMDWTGALNNPTWGNPSNFMTNVYGSLTLNSNMTIGTNGGLCTFKATATGKTITSFGKTVRGFIFNGVGGGWILNDDLSTNPTLTLNAGTLNTNNKTVNCVGFFGSGTTARTLTLGSSVINSSNNFTFTDPTNLTLNAGTSTIKMLGNSTIFAGGGLTFNNVEFQGTPTTITGSNTFNTLTIAAGKTLSLTSVTTQTITSLACNGTLANPSTLQSVTAASPATIALPAGRYFIRHTSIKDITITGATSVTSIAGTNVSGNTGITFVTKFEMGRIKNDGSFNWYNTSTGTVTKISG